MSETIQIRPSASSPDADHVPIPKAYEKAKACLKEMVSREMAAVSRNLALPLMQKLGLKKFLQEFKQQLLAYARGTQPFKKAWNEEKGTLAWWKSLLDDDDAWCLAVHS
jgi:hypothetical protein